MPIYHYYAKKQIGITQVAEIDGIAIMRKPILNMADYADLKKLIVEGQGLGGENGLTICSLTLLQE